MKSATLVGIILILAGAAGLVLGTFTYQKEKTVFQMGDLQATTKEDHVVPLKLAGGIALAAGVLLVIAGSRK